MKIGEFLKSERERQGYSIADISKMSGVKYATLYSYEEFDVQPSFLAMAKICETLGISMDKIIREVDL